MYLTKNSKSPYYQIIYTNDNRLTSKSTGKKLKSEALKYLSQFEKNLINEKIIKPVKLSEFRKEYEKFILIKSKSYQKSVSLSFNQIQSYLKTDLLIKNIDIRIVESFIHSIYNRSETASNLYHRTLKAAFSKAGDWGYIKQNPFRLVKLLKVSKPFPVFINETELQLILNNTNESYLRIIFLTAFYSGMRLGEILNLEWESINFRDKIITVQNKDSFNTKNRKDRIIPMNEILFNSLQSIKPKIITLNNTESNYIFYRMKGIKLNEDYVSKRFKKAVRKAKLNDKIHFHSLRHSFASLLAQRGVSLLIIKELLGHSSLRVTEIYSHLQQKNLSNAVQQLGRAI